VVLRAARSNPETGGHVAIDPVDARRVLGERLCWQRAFARVDDADHGLVLAYPLDEERPTIRSTRASSFWNGNRLWWLAPLTICVANRASAGEGKCQLASHVHNLR
jgi:hypothetical protein